MKQHLAVKDLPENSDIFRPVFAVRIIRIGCFQCQRILAEQNRFNRYFVVVQQKNADILVVEIILLLHEDDISFPDPQTDH